MKTVYCIYYRSMHTALSGLICFDSLKKAQTNYYSFTKNLEILDKEVEKGNPDYVGRADDIYGALLNVMLEDADEVIEEIDYRDMKDISYYGKWRKCYETEDVKYIAINTNRLDLFM